MSNPFNEPVIEGLLNSFRLWEVREREIRL